MKVWTEPVLAPFPDIADAVVEAVPVGLESVDRARSFEAVFAGVLFREVALENVAAELSASQQRIAPRPDLLFEPSASCAFPFGFRRQTFARPATVRLCVVPRNLHDRMIENVVYGRARPGWMFPGGSRNGEPPFEAGDCLRLTKLFSLFLRDVKLENERPAETFCLGDIASRVDKLRELLV